MASGTVWAVRGDARRKILIGAVVIAKVDQGVTSESDLRAWLNAALTRADNRALFGLPPA